MIPHGDWICDLCKEIGQTGKFLRCPLCQEIGGAMKKSVLNCETQLFANLNPFYHDYLRKCQKNHSLQLKTDMANLEENQEVTSIDVWVHLTCVLWLPETYFQDKQTYSNVRGLENIDPKKFDAFCVICQSSSIFKKFFFFIFFILLFFFLYLSFFFNVKFEFFKNSF